jgi:hypothetical protein
MPAFKVKEICEFFFIMCRRILQHFKDVLFSQSLIEQSLMTQHYMAIRQIIYELNEIRSHSADATPFIDIKSLKINITNDDVSFFKTLIKLDLYDFNLLGPIGLHRLLTFISLRVFSNLRITLNHPHEVETIKRIKKRFFKISNSLKRDISNLPFDSWHIFNERTKFSSISVDMEISYD